MSRACPRGDGLAIPALTTSTGKAISLVEAEANEPRWQPTDPGLGYRLLEPAEWCIARCCAGST